MLTAISILALATNDPVQLANEADLLHAKLSVKTLEPFTTSEDGQRILWTYQVGFKNQELSKVAFMHIWALECGPCVKEMPDIKKLVDRLREISVKSVFVVETADREKIEKYFLGNGKLFVKIQQYYAGNSDIRKTIGDMTQPMSFLIDGDLMVREAFIGPLNGRHKQVVDAAMRLNSGIGLAKYFSPQVKPCPAVPTPVCKKEIPDAGEPGCKPCPAPIVCPPLNVPPPIVCPSPADYPPQQPVQPPTFWEKYAWWVLPPGIAGPIVSLLIGLRLGRRRRSPREQD